MAKLFVSFILSIFIGINVFAQEITLNTEISPPYQIMVGGDISGVSVEILKCIFKKMNVSYNINIVPWKRAQKNVQNNETNGFFIVMSFAELDKYATLSAPIALEKWYFYFKDPTLLQNKNFKQGIKIGVIRGNNQSAWLKANGYFIAQEVKNYKQLIKLLDFDRIHAFLADQKTFGEEISRLSLNDDQFLSTFIKYTPLGIYFSNSFLKTHPEFLEEFNKNVYICVPEAVKLNKQEEQRLHNLATSKIMKWINNPLVITMIKDQNQKHQALSQPEIINLDKQWRKEAKSVSSPLIDKLLTNSLSQYLKKIKKESNGLYSEIFVMDNKGLNVAQSDETSDYWQGDETKFKKTFEIGKNTFFIDEIEYDESSREFQVQINLTISDPSSGAPIGALTVGINIEKALTDE